MAAAKAPLLDGNYFALGADADAGRGSAAPTPRGARPNRVSLSRGALAVAIGVLLSVSVATLVVASRDPHCSDNHGGHGDSSGHEGGDAHDAMTPWAYTGLRGPNNWAKLDPKFGACASTVRQSPIAVDTSRLQGSAPRVRLEYPHTPVAFTLADHEGHDLAAVPQRGAAAGAVVLEPADGSGPEQHFDLINIHFHHPSEHTIDGRVFDAEFHLVHRNEHSGAMVVVSVPVLNATAAAPAVPLPRSQLLARMLGSVPAIYGSTLTVTAVPAEILGGVLSSTQFVSYPGSLTTPPCSEVVTWVLLTTPLSLSRELLDALPLAYDNDRPRQPLNGRRITQPGALGGVTVRG